MNASRLVAVLLIGGAAPALAEPREESVAPLVQKALPGIAGKQFTAAIVMFPPRARAVPHRHGGAFLYAYVLDGNVRSQIEGEPVRTYRVGQGWTEEPGAHHVLTENASARKPARLLVTFVSSEGEPLKIPDAQR
jgi:quercetin dioxygenase-like cupin family protein